MKIYTEWYRHVEAWRESGLSQADYCRQQGLNPKTFSAWARRALLIEKDAPSRSHSRSSDAIGAGPMQACYYSLRTVPA